MFDFTKFTNLPTAADYVEQTRRTSTFALSFIPVTEIRDEIAKMVNNQCNLADVFAGQIDQAVADVKKAWKFA